jgi:Tol biopolymer transport system component
MYKLTRRIGVVNLALCACTALVLSACGNPLRQEPTPEPALSPTRTPVSQQEQIARVQATPTSAPKPTAESRESSATATAKPTAAATMRYDACSKVKPNVGQRTPDLASTEGQIVYVTTDNNIVLTDPTGRKQTPITSDAFVSDNRQAGRVYQFPTFSNDGRFVAFVSLSASEGFDGITNTVHVAPVSGSATITDLYSTTEWNIPYLDWSPNSNHIAFLTISRVSGAIRVVERDGGEIAIFDTGSPTYWHWRSDSAAMVTHLGGRATTKGKANVSVIEAKGAVKGAQVIIEELPGAFQSPHWSPDGRHVLFAANTDGRDELVLADAGGKPLCTLEFVEDSAYFAWSPNGKYIAVLDTAPSPPGILVPAALTVYEPSAGTSKVVHEEASMFFWSPDGEKLAVYSIVFNTTITPLGAGVGKLGAPLAQGGSPALRIEIINVATGNKIKVADTYPSRQFIQYFPYFDQYSRAITPWSPDGRRLVLASISPTRETADIAVATLNAAQTGVDLNRIAAGTIAFWSPR